LPADLLPGLEADPEDPARALSNRRAQAGGEELAGGDELLHALAPHDAVPATDLALVLHRVGGEERALSCEAELEPDLVVFGEALDVERELAVRERDLLERVARECAAHAGRRHEAADATAHDHVLEVVLSELVDVRATDELTNRNFERKDRRLHEVAPWDPIVVVAKREWMDDVLGV